MLYSTLHPKMMPLTVLFDHWIFNFGIPDVVVIDNGNEYINGDFTHFRRTYNVQFKPRTPNAPWSDGLVENSNHHLNTFLRTVLGSQYDTWSQKVKVLLFAFNSQVKKNMNLLPYELVFDQKPKKPIMFNLFSTTDSLGNCKTTENSPCNSLPNHTHTDYLGYHHQIKKLQKEPLHIGFSIVKRYTRKFIMKYTIYVMKYAHI